MIDSALIKQNIDNFAHSIAVREPIIQDHLCKLSNCFTQSITDKLLSYLQRPDLDWTSVHNQENMSRRSITWESDTVIEELHSVCQAQTELLSDTYQLSLHFIGNQIWQDTENYFIGWHKDNPIIAVAAQIYLFDTPAKFGTTFSDDQQKQLYVLPFEHNTGYIANHHAHSYRHRASVKIPSGLKRHSLYSIWSLTPKT